MAQGKKMVNGIPDSTYLLASCGLCYALVIFAVVMIGLSFSFKPSQLDLTAFSVGVPALFLTLFAPAKDRDESLLHSVLTFVLPFAVFTMLFAVGFYVYYDFEITDELADGVPERLVERFEETTGLVYGVDAQFDEVVITFISQTNLSNFLSLATMLMILFLYPPYPFFAVWRPVTPDKRPALMTVGLIITYVLVLELNVVQDRFGIIGTPEWAWGVLAGVLAVWFLGFRLILKHKWAEEILLTED